MPRTNLKIGKVQPERTIQGKNGIIPILAFLATNPAGQQFKYGIFAKKELFPYVKTSQTIDAEVTETDSKQTNPETGQPYKNRNVVNIYVNDKPVMEQERRGGWNRPDNSASIERQVAIKEIGECWRAGKFSDDDKLVTAYKVWLSGRMSPPPVSTPEKQATVASKADPEPPPPFYNPRPPDDNPTLTEALKCKTGVELFNFALKHGMNLEKIYRDTGTTDPKTIQDVQASARVLFGK